MNDTRVKDVVFTPSKELEWKGINTIRGLVLDSVERANSGHPGAALALAPLAHVLFTRVMRYSASEPDWFDRDRFVLSAGHISALLYSILHLTGTSISLDDLKNFRQLGSVTPGHPEVNHTPGVDTTTGPLGQGFANAVGMAIAERHLRSRFGTQLCDHFTWGICGDGDLQEGLSHEAASIAGHQKLGRLTFIYDNNHISIDGPTSLSYSEDTAKRFEAYQWHVQDIGESANDLDAIDDALSKAKEETERPSLIILRSHIGYPSEKFLDSSAAHGAPFGKDETRAVKQKLGLDPDKEFFVDQKVREMYRSFGDRFNTDLEKWRSNLSNSALAEQFQNSLSSKITIDLNSLPEKKTSGSVANRSAFGSALSSILPQIPQAIVGAADVTSSVGLDVGGDVPISDTNPGGTQIYWGVREHGMAAAINGMAIHGGVLPIGGLFFIFSDYQKPAIRLAAMMGSKSIFVWTHDSIGVGEDGPTHQPVEQLMSFRSIPGLVVIRPADANESVFALRAALEQSGPVGIVLTRQKVPVIESDKVTFENFIRGAYVLEETNPSPEVILIGTGSETNLCLDVSRLIAKHVRVRVVSMPSWELFEKQDETYKKSVLPEGAFKFAVEAGSPLGWERYANSCHCIDTFGTSAPGERAFEFFGFNAETIASEVMKAYGERNDSIS